MTIELLEMLAVSDEATFEAALNKVGLTILGKQNSDPLDTSVLAESVAAIATEITDTRHEYVDAAPLVLEAKKLAEDYGYIVGFVDSK